MYIPKRLQSNFTITDEKAKDYILISGHLLCCKKEHFSLFYHGIVNQDVFGHNHITSNRQNIALVANCKKCSKSITIFDNAIDGYDACISERKKHYDMNIKEYLCPKCKQNDFSVYIKYEYLPNHELEDESIQDINLAFSWIWVSVKCNVCGKKNNHLINYETS